MTKSKEKAIATTYNLILHYTFWRHVKKGFLVLPFPSCKILPHRKNCRSIRKLLSCDTKIGVILDRSHVPLRKFSHITLQATKRIDLDTRSKKVSTSVGRSHHGKPNVCHCLAFVASRQCCVWKSNLDLSNAFEVRGFDDSGKSILHFHHHFTILCSTWVIITEFCFMKQ